MSIRIHTADVTSVGISYDVDPAEYFEDEEMDVGPCLIIEDGGNGEAFVLVGTVANIAHFARKILAELPTALTDDEEKYLVHICEDHEYDREDGSIGRTHDGWAFFTSGEDATSYDLTNGQLRAVEYDNF
jgi:hypothetical protein